MIEISTMNNYNMMFWSVFCWRVVAWQLMLFAKGAIKGEYWEIKGNERQQLSVCDVNGIQWANRREDG